MMRAGVVLVAVLALSGCGADVPVAGGTPSATPSGTPSASGTPTPGSTVSGGPGGSLTFTRRDGSTFSLAAGDVSCGPSPTDEKRLAIMVRSSPWPTADQFGKADRFELEAILDDVASGATIKLPSSYVYNDAHGADMFAVDKLTMNELSSNQEEASGTIVIRRASCEPKPAIEVAVDAVLGPELHGLEEVAVKGTFSLHG